MTGEKILVVDGEPSIREVVSYELERRGFDLTAVGDGQTALDLIRIDPPDLLILDVMLRGVDVYEITRQVRASSTIPIILLTEPRDKIKGFIDLKLGADDYIAKPFSLRELAARVKAVLRRTQKASTPPGGDQTHVVKSRTSPAKQILIVVDEPRMAQFIKWKLDLEGYQTLEANNGFQALEEIRKHEPNLVLLDVEMQGQDGFETLKHLRKFSDIPTIMLSVRSDEEVLIRGWELDADDILMKPFSSQELSSRIRAVLRRTQQTVAPPGGDQPISVGSMRIAPRTRLETIEGEKIALFPRLILRQLLADYGPALLNEPARVDAFLADLCGQYPRERFLLVHALRERIPDKLQAQPHGGGAHELWLSQRLQKRYSFSAEAAHWAIESWFFALDIAPLRPNSPRDGRDIRDGGRMALSESPQRILCQLLTDYGPALINNPTRVDALLADFCGPYPRERFLLVHALRERIPVELSLAHTQRKRILAEHLTQPQGTTIHGRSLSQRLHSRYGFSAEAAQWAVESCSLALNIAPPAQDQTPSDKPLSAVEEVMLQILKYDSRTEAWVSAEVLARQKKEERNAAELAVRQKEEEQNAARAVAHQKVEARNVAEATVRQKAEERNAARAAARQKEEERNVAEATVRQKAKERNAARVAARQVAKEMVATDSVVRQKAREQGTARVRARQKAEEMIVAEAVVRQKEKTGGAARDAAYKNVEEWVAAKAVAYEKAEEWVAAELVDHEKVEEWFAAKAADHQKTEEWLVAAKPARQKAEEQVAARAVARQKAAEQAAAEAEVHQKAKELAAAEVTARQKAKEQAAAEAKARHKAEEQAAAEAKARHKAEEQAAAEAKARHKAKEQVAAEVTARQKAREQVAAEAAAHHKVRSHLILLLRARSEALARQKAEEQAAAEAAARQKTKELAAAAEEQARNLAPAHEQPHRQSRPHSPKILQQEESVCPSPSPSSPPSSSTPTPVKDQSSPRHSGCQWLALLGILGLMALLGQIY